MVTILQLDSSPSPASVTREVSREYVQTWLAQNPDGTLIYRDLVQAPPPVIDAEWIGASYTAPAQRSAAQNAVLALSDELVGELERADEYVIGVAMHNFSIPSVLKLWIDQIARSGRTFSYGAGGAKGLLNDKRVTLVVATGGVYTPGTPAASFSHVEPYLRTCLGSWASRISA